jgi:hypothetical protein
MTTKRQRDQDPVTQPVRIPTSERSPARRPSPFKAWFRWLGWSKRPETPKPLAFLTPLDKTGGPTMPAPLPIWDGPVTLGRDSLQASLVIDDPSVESLHARLVHEAGSFRLLDAGSVAGTWVNFTPIPPEGVLLEHADLVYLGRCGFRFTLRVPGRLRKPTVQLLEPPA